MKITLIKQQANRANRYSIYIDGKYAFSLSESGLLESGLVSGQELDAEQLKRLKKAADLDKAYYNALRYAALRPHSQWEIETYLNRKGVDSDTSAEIVRRLKNLNMLSDLDFARSWIANRRQLKSTSKRRLRLELMQKRVTEEVIDQALGEDGADERQVLRDLIAKKRRRYPDNQKLIRYLASQGFNYDDIKQALKSEE